MVDDFVSERELAKKYRKEGNLGNALKLYRKLWSTSRYEVDAAGMLHCLRKLKMFSEAEGMVKSLESTTTKINWLRNEIIWFYLEGVLYGLSETTPIHDVLKVAQKIVGLEPDSVALKALVMKVIKLAKQANKWDIVNDWVVKLDPNSLDNLPKFFEKRVAWSERAIWYNYRIKGLIKQGQNEEALRHLAEIKDQFAEHRKYFLRYEGMANYNTGVLDKAESIYGQLCSRPNVDWWLLTEYASVVNKQGEKNKDINKQRYALELMLRSAQSNRGFKLESMVTLLANIGMLSADLGNIEQAAPHLVLCKKVRDEKNWKVPEALKSYLEKINVVEAANYSNFSIGELLKKCRSIWDVALGINVLKEKKSIQGFVRLGTPEREFCFIYTGQENYFCHKSQLPKGVKDRDKVIAEIIPAYDKKKEQHSFKAVNVRVIIA